MKKTVALLIIILAAALMCGCTAQGDGDMRNTDNTENTEKITLTVVNNVADADVWILPDTEANRKTTLWGAATINKVSAGESRSAELCEPGDGGLYLLRMIDTDGFYYSANGLALGDGYTLTLAENDTHEVTAEVTDAKGALLGAYEVFSARL